MADGDLGAHVVEQVVEIGAMIHVRQQLAVHLFHLRPIGAVHVRHVEIIALVAPAFIEYLFELFFRVEVHAQRYVEPSLSRLRRLAIGVHQEERRTSSAARALAATTPPAAEAAARAIDQLVTVRAHVVLGDAGDERRGPAIAQTVTLQRVSTAASSEPASTTPASCRGFEIIDCARDAGAQLRVLTLRNPRHGNDSLLQSVEVYLNGDRRARRARRLRGRVGLGGVSRSIAGAGRSATASSTEAAAATGRRAAHTVVFIALRQERARLAFL